MTIVNERVLVADDDANVRAYLADVLDAAGYEVTTSADGQEALECLDRWRPGAILLDVRMPRVDGRAFCERLGMRSDLADIPVLIMSSPDALDDRIPGCHAVGVLEKPFDRADLLAAVWVATQL